ncbi:hypothetical protein HDU85_000617 [Gaertneriomyces sp. JEL0708]|nr:hypothetical protein HDU85_000617 [Gaertneriomyces sp. JEL0708]
MASKMGYSPSSGWWPTTVLRRLIRPASLRLLLLIAVLALVGYTFYLTEDVGNGVDKRFHESQNAPVEPADVLPKDNTTNMDSDKEEKRLEEEKSLEPESQSPNQANPINEQSQVGNLKDAVLSTNEEVEDAVQKRLSLLRLDIEKEYEEKLAQAESKLRNLEASVSSVKHELPSQRTIEEMFSVDDSPAPERQIFKNQLTTNLGTIRNVKLHGFKMCNMLEGSSFDAWTTITPIGGSLLTANPSQGVITSMVDTLALKVYDNIMEWAASDKRGLERNSVRRFACYMAAHGENEYAVFSRGPFLTHIDGKSYFPALSLRGPGTRKENESDGWEPHPARRIVRRSNGEIVDGAHDEAFDNSEMLEDRAVKPARKKYKMAYLLLIHERLDIFSQLFSALYSLDGVFLLHVDAKQTAFRKELGEWLSESETYKDAENIFIMDDPMVLHWGGSSLVMAQLEGFFRLQDLADWDYVVNLSGYDYPLRSTSAMHAILERDPGKAYIRYWPNNEVNRRLSQPSFLDESGRSMYKPGMAPHRKYSLSHRFGPMKHHQWMILPNDFVSYLRTSTDAHDLLAWIEHSFIPDEDYFAMVALAKSTEEGGWRENVVNDCKRYIRFNPGAPHPNWLRDGDEDKLEPGARVEVALPRSMRTGTVEESEEEYFFVRKVNSRWESKLRAWMDNKRREVDEALKDEIAAIDEAFRRKRQQVYGAESFQAESTGPSNEDDTGYFVQPQR